MTLHGSNTSLASADQTLSGSETEDLATPQMPQVIFPGAHLHSEVWEPALAESCGRTSPEYPYLNNVWEWNAGGSNSVYYILEYLDCWKSLPNTT